MYKICGNEELITQAKNVINSALPSCYSEKTDFLAETSDILDRLIKDRSSKIDECVNDALKYINTDFFTGQFCTIILDKTTEETIDCLFEREEKIFKIKPNAELIIQKSIKL